MTLLLGCSFTAEEALIAAGLEPRHIKETGIVPMFRTTNRPKALANSPVPTSSASGPMRRMRSAPPT